METINILNKYFDRGKVDDILTQNHVRSLFPKHTDLNSIEVIMDYIRKRKYEVIQQIQNEVAHEFSVPLADIIRDIKDFNNTSSHRHTLELLVKNLEDVSTTTGLCCTNLDAEIALVLTQVKELTENIGNLANYQIDTAETKHSIEVLNDLITNDP